MILRGAKIILFLACTLETRIAARLGSGLYRSVESPPHPRADDDRQMGGLIETLSRPRDGHMARGEGDSIARASSRVESSRVEDEAFVVENRSHRF